ncbi:aspartyl protease family protein [Yersinia thracica]|uniref:aspartyl protease family protein n=1 Tax=Yersinia thracica TaxID=2890319 RepID=UPI00119FC806|nr:aspartyl protease family protein [Yersinia thracica]
MHFLPNKHITAMTFVLLSSVATPAALSAIAPEKVMHMPFEWDDTAVPVVSVEINGLRQSFSIDTGSEMGLHLTKEVMAQLPGLVPVEGKRRSIDLAGKVLFNEKFYIPQLSINGMTFKNVKGVTFSPWGLALTPKTAPRNSMVMGLDLFKEKAVLINYKSQLLSVADNTQALGINMADGWIALPLRLTPEGIELKISKNAKEYNMVLDTGATVSVFWKERLESAVVSLPCQTLIGDIEMEGCVASDFQLNEMGTKEISFNAVLLDGVFNQMDTDGLIGNNFLNKFAVLIDFPGQRLLIRKFKNT